MKKRHFDGLFLDTLDSFNAYTDEKADKALYDRQVEGLTELVNDIHSIHPKLIFNRGFEIFDRIGFKPEAVAGESIFKSYNSKANKYTDVSKSDREWLSSKFDHVKSAGVEAIALDYLPDTDLDARIALAKDISQKGYTPYVSDGMLYGFGVSYTYSVPKRILGVYDGTLGEPNLSFIHSTVTTPLEYNGYVVDLVDIYNIDVNQLQKSKYAALVFYPADSGGYTENTELMSWLISHVGYIPTLFLGVLPTNSEFLNAYGIEFLGEIDPPYSFDRKPAMSKGIIDPPFSPNDRLFSFSVDENKGFKVQASVKNPAGA
ncbi:hypothetical protein SAMN02745213_02155 [Succinivibrio dextrinosolvens DSM 3072]|uniref:Glycoside-hydrolase family GH114 TIM-barrel domain-containing protein n=1 Tax=Succinivibrio dextrinosolvens DSM 3072 TaxID=1123324 RepID=A0A1T4VVK3_9GAMM|nr:hypothetical protein [Succinivibrio dextrinosolvens]SKA69040.1 hypothetical protein SAMN02745213_02155 [Succinivibrio dextrinosolvens DSM 3072]